MAGDRGSMEPLTWGCAGDRLVLRGELDLGSVDEVVKVLGRFAGRRCEVDVAGVTFIDSTGIRALVEAKRANPQLRVVEVPAGVARVLDIAGVLELLTG